MKYFFSVLLLSCLWLQSSAQVYKNEFGFTTENDAYLATLNDRYYTNGLFLYYRRAINPANFKTNIAKKTYEISVAQKIYTPYSGDAPIKENQDRPFAGYLDAGATYSVFYKNEFVLKTTAQIGTVGSNSLAEKGQKLLHKTVGFYTPEGWEYQIKNELAINLSANAAKLLYRTNDKIFDVTGEGYANLGTTFSGAGISALLRIGKLNQLFNSSSYNATIGETADKRFNEKEFFFYLRPKLNYVAYDATIQGSLFNNDSPVTFGVKPIVYEQQAGVNYTIRRLSFDFSLIFKTKEVKSVAEAQNYGSFSMVYRFN
ncbi:lipid A 3-O-deacylase [Pedobacter sp. UYP30]|uniref:lipid A deacylase LpxR family protein n=1 Tax=Pedobacter sp. UYP30 TaxID=1756400 RepID=UPI003398D940